MFSSNFFFVFLFSLTHCDSSPDQLDWRAKGAVLPVPEQTPCGGQPALTNALDAISAKIQIRTGKLVKLSRQQIYDCSDNWCPCDAFTANVTQVYRMIESKNISKALETEDRYPYTETCAHKCPKSVTNYTLDSYVTSPDDVYLEENLSCWLVTGPVAVNVNTDCDEFMMYHGGILNTINCHGAPNHVLLLVGYDTENKQDYWIARNSWGTDWGEKGYVRIARGRNVLGIGNGFTLPL